MPRYFFNTDDGHPFHDESGTELATDEAARLEATLLFAQLLAEQPEAVWRDQLFRVTVTNSAGLTLFVLDLAAIAAPALRPT